MNVPVLTGRANYRQWALEIKAAAQLLNVYQAFQGMDEPTDHTVKSDVADFKRREERAIGLIACTCSLNLKIEFSELLIADSNVTGGKREATAAEMWSYLRTKFEKIDSFSAILDFGRLNRTKFVDDGTLEQQLNESQELCSCCRLNGFKQYDWQYSAILLFALPDSFKSIREHILATLDDLEKLDPDHIRARVLEHQACREEEQDKSAADIVTTQPGKCTNCGKLGHWANSCCSGCNKKKKKKNSAPSPSQLKDKSGNHRLDVLQSEGESDPPIFC